MKFFRTLALMSVISFSTTTLYASYESGISSYKKNDYEAALKEFRSCPQDASCQNALGVMYSSGFGVSKDLKEAAKWFLLAAEQGLNKGQYNLANAYLKGEGVHQSFKEALKWHQLAATQGYPESQYDMAVMYTRGQGVPIDFKEAAKWFRLSADQGFVPSYFHLGVLYEKGQGVTQDYKEAVKWYRLAADKNDKESQTNLGAMYARGTGVVQNFVVSYALANLAVANGEDSAALRNRDTNLKRLTSSDVSVAQRLASEMHQSGKVTAVIDRYLRTGK